MKKISSIVLVMLCTLLFTGLQAQTLEQILNRHFEAVNQKKTLEVQTTVMKARVLQMGMEMPMVIKIKKPNKIRMEMDIQGQQMITAYDGSRGWMMAPFAGPGIQDLPGEQLSSLKDQANFEGELWKYAEKGHAAELLGKQDVDGKSAYAIKLTKKNGDVVTYYLDADSYLLMKEVTQTLMNGSPVEGTQVYTNYKTVSGIPVAMNVESSSMGQSALLVIDEVEFDVALDDEIFARPVK
ncbi:MAG: outer membrane lipoprotein-sorting protein [Bacteroidales bacterium]